MYKKDKSEWLKHIDFMILDMLCLQCAFILGYIIRMQNGNVMNMYSDIMYRNMAIFLTLADLIVMFIWGTFKNVLKRDCYKNFSATVEHVLIVAAISVGYLFLVQQGDKFSRLVLMYTMIIYLLLSYVVKQLWKEHLKKNAVKREAKKSLLVIANRENAKHAIESIEINNYDGYGIAGLVLLDEDFQSQEGCVEYIRTNVGNIEVVADKENAARYICLNWIDEVLILPSKPTDYPSELIEQISKTGVTIHVGIGHLKKEVGRKQTITKVGDCTVLTTSINIVPSGQLFIKRLIDICGGFVGCILTGIIVIFVGPMIYISSPGPIFFSQERIGKNGKKFKLYKFRSMYIDAEARKAELMKDNKLGDGKMFKLDFDPRVIGNKVMPDGSYKTGVGQFLRSSSLDEFPQFFNVLKGDMSIVGTRPPLESETNLYELHHRARLAIKPGITGMWQVSGRSEIIDFEEVVRLDKEYIENWSLGLDIKILFKTVAVVLGKKGSV